MDSRKIAFGYYGGKFSQLGWLLPLLPRAQHYCEPFGGSAAVLLNREPAPLETYNDLYGDIVHFFRMLRDHRDELLRRVAMTPYAREEYTLSMGSGSLPEDPLERARRFYVRLRQCVFGQVQDATDGRWGYCLNDSRRGMSSAVSKWWSGMDGLEAIAERLMRVQFEHAPAMEIIPRYDTPDTLFYCDPPYLPSTHQSACVYENAMSLEDYAALADALNACQGKVALSGYDDPIMQDWFSSRNGWFKTVQSAKSTPLSKGLRTEVLWTNYNPSSRSTLQSSLFDLGIA